MSLLGNNTVMNEYTSQELKDPKNQHYYHKRSHNVYSEYASMKPKNVKLNLFNKPK